MLFVFILIFVFVFCIYNLDKEPGFTFFAVELFVLSSVEFSSADRAKRDVGLHVVLDTKIHS